MMLDCFMYLLGFLLILAALEALIIVFLLIKDWRYASVESEHNVHTMTVKGKIHEK